MPGMHIISFYAHALVCELLTSHFTDEETEMQRSEEFDRDTELVSRERDVGNLRPHSSPLDNTLPLAHAHTCQCQADRADRQVRRTFQMMSTEKIHTPGAERASGGTQGIPGSQGKLLEGRDSWADPRRITRRQPGVGGECWTPEGP